MVEQFCDWLAATSLSVAFQTAVWFVPLVQTLHILAISILLTSTYIISFRLIGFTFIAQPVGTLAGRLMPWIWIALAVLLATGALLTITEPARELLNWAFRTKMILVLLLAALLRLLQVRLRSDPLYWSESPGRRVTGRAIGIASLLVSASIVTAGRWIAYV